MPEFDYLMTARRLKDGGFEAEPGPVRYLKVPRTTKIPTPAHIVQGAGAIQQWVDEVCGLADGDANPNPSVRLATFSCLSTATTTTSKPSHGASASWRRI